MLNWDKFRTAARRRYELAVAAGLARSMFRTRPQTDRSAVDNRIYGEGYITEEILQMWKLNGGGEGEDAVTREFEHKGLFVDYGDTRHYIRRGYRINVPLVDACYIYSVPDLNAPCTIGKYDTLQEFLDANDTCELIDCIEMEVPEQPGHPIGFIIPHINVCDVHKEMVNEIKSFVGAGLRGYSYLAEFASLTLLPAIDFDPKPGDEKQILRELNTTSRHFNDAYVVDDTRSPAAKKALYASAIAISYARCVTDMNEESLRVQRRIAWNTGLLQPEDVITTLFNTKGLFIRHLLGATVDMLNLQMKLEQQSYVSYIRSGYRFGTYNMNELGLLYQSCALDQEGCHIRCGKDGKKHFTIQQMLDVHGNGDEFPYNEMFWKVTRPIGFVVPRYTANASTIQVMQELLRLPVKAYVYIAELGTLTSLTDIAVPRQPVGDHYEELRRRAGQPEVKHDWRPPVTIPDTGLICRSIR